jgi:hypothetical protein
MKVVLMDHQKCRIQVEHQLQNGSSGSADQNIWYKWIIRKCRIPRGRTSGANGHQEVQVQVEHLNCKWIIRKCRFQKWNITGYK